MSYIIDEDFIRQLREYMIGDPSPYQWDEKSGRLEQAFADARSAAMLSAVGIDSHAVDPAVWEWLVTLSEVGGWTSWSRRVQALVPLAVASVGTRRFLTTDMRADFVTRVTKSVRSACVKKALQSAFDALPGPHFVSAWGKSMDAWLAGKKSQWEGDFIRISDLIEDILGGEAGRAAQNAAMAAAYAESAVCQAAMPGISACRLAMRNAAEAVRFSSLAMGDDKSANLVLETAALRSVAFLRFVNVPARAYLPCKLPEVEEGE